MTIAGASYREGIAYSPDGAMYVTLASGSVIPAPTFTGSAGFADGTAAVPSIAWTSDADGTGTGLYRSAANQVAVAINGVQMHTFSANTYQINSDTGQFAFGTSFDAIIARTGVNGLRFGTAASSTLTSRTEFNKPVAAIANAVATDVLTVTIPNAAHSASLLVRVTGSLGAGGAIGANEATATNTYIIGITRTAGVAAVATATAAFGAVAVAVAGAATVTATAAVTAMSGAVGATQTFTVQITISRSGGSSDNHTCLVYAQLMNANAAGITIA